MRSGRFAVLLAACAVSAYVAGCAGSQHRTTSSDDIVCTDHAPTGSHIVQARCDKRGNIEDRRRADRAAMERWQEQANRPVAQPQRSGGGAAGPN